MTTDKEIISIWNKLPINTKQSEAAIRLWRMAEKQHKYDKPTIEEIARLEKEAYARGMREACVDCTAFQDGIKKGQAEIIGELTNIEFCRELHSEYEKAKALPMEWYKEHALQVAMRRTLAKAVDVIKALESAEAKETKPEKPKKSYGAYHSNKACEKTSAVNCVACDCSCHNKETKPEKKKKVI
jgi:hypothetical protein